MSDKKNRGAELNSSAPRLFLFQRSVRRYALSSAEMR